MRRAVGAARALFVLLAVMAWPAASSADALKLRLPAGCLGLVTVVAADCTVRHVARCADYPGGIATFRSDPVGRLRERVDRAGGLIAERVWRPAEPPATIAPPETVTTRIGRFFVELDPALFLSPEELEGRIEDPLALPSPIPEVGDRLAIVQRTVAVNGEPLRFAARRLEALDPGERLVMGLDLRLTPAAAAAGRPLVTELIQRGGRAADVRARVLDGANPRGQVALRLYSFAVRSSGGEIALSETRFFAPVFGAVLGRRLDGLVDGAPVRRDGAPIALFRQGVSGFLDPAADERVAACVPEK